PISQLAGAKFYARVVFDLAYFIVLGVLLFDMVTGVIIDTFSALREETASREEALKNECICCGLRRENFIEFGQEFRQHIDEEHNLWGYLFFMHYLKDKDPSSMNGAEAFVLEQIKRKNYSWFP
ncbi:unnamed protein product, partial [Discosporangium mesarthrocarpum]